MSLSEDSCYEGNIRLVLFCRIYIILVINCLGLCSINIFFTCCNFFFCACVADRQWSLVKTRSKKDDPLLAPCAKCRYGHSVCSYNGRVYMFGGRNDDDGSMSSVACFDIG